MKGFCFLCIWFGWYLEITCAKIYVVSPLGQFPTDPSTQTWLQSTSLASTFNAVKERDAVYVCDGEVFEGPFTFGKKNVNLSSYPCNQSNAGIKPFFTVSRQYQGTPTVNPISLQWTYDLSGYKQYFDVVPSIAGLWINGTRYYPARFPNLIDPANPVGQSTSEFIYPQPWSSSTPYNMVNSLQPSSPLKNMSSNYWVGATLRIRETDWGYTSRTVAAVQSGKLIMSANFSNADTISGGGFFIEQNSLAEMDAPGEFYFDSVAYKLYVMPMSGHQPSSEMWFLAQNATLIASGGGKGAALAIDYPCVINGFQFRYGFVAIDGSNSLSLTNTDVRDMVSLGVDGNIRMVNCTFSDIGAIGANLMPGPFNLLVQSSSFKNVALWAGYYAQPTGIMCFAQCTVQGSTFDGMGYAAIYPNSAYSVVTGNAMSNVMLGLADGGAVYYGSQTGLIFTGNSVVNIVGNTLSGSVGHRAIISTGFYLDTFAYNATVVGNTIVTNYGATPDLMQSCVKLDNGNTTVTDNVCVGGKFDIEMTSSAVVLGLVIDRNVFTPTPGTPGQTVPLLISLGGSRLSPPYLPTRATFRSITNNTFCMTSPNTSAAAWSPIYLGYTPISTANNLGISNFVNISTNRKDTSGRCFSSTTSLGTTTGGKGKATTTSPRPLSTKQPSSSSVRKTTTVSASTSAAPAPVTSLSPSSSSQAPGPVTSSVLPLSTTYPWLPPSTNSSLSESANSSLLSPTNASLPPPTNSSMPLPSSTPPGPGRRAGARPVLLRSVPRLDASWESSLAAHLLRRHALVSADERPRMELPAAARPSQVRREASG